MKKKKNYNKNKKHCIRSSNSAFPTPDPLPDKFHLSLCVVNITDNTEVTWYIQRNNYYCLHMHIFLSVCVCVCVRTYTPNFCMKLHLYGQCKTTHLHWYS